MSAQDYPLDPAEVQAGTSEAPDDAGVVLPPVADTDGDGIPDDIDPVDDTALEII